MLTIITILVVILLAVAVPHIVSTINPIEESIPMFNPGDIVQVKTFEEAHKAIVVRVDDPHKAIVVKVHYYSSPGSKWIRFTCYASELAHR